MCLHFRGTDRYEYDRKDDGLTNFFINFIRYPEKDQRGLDGICLNNHADVSRTAFLSFSNGIIGALGRSCYLLGYVELGIAQTRAHYE